MEIKCFYVLTADDIRMMVGKSEKVENVVKDMEDGKPRMFEGKLKLVCDLKNDLEN